MVTRTVTVRLRADINQYTRGMRTAARSTSQVAGAGAAVGTAMVAGFALAAASAAKFDKELSNVRAVTGASAKDMAKLRAAALEAGKTTSFTATEAARAEAELARAGISTANIIGGALKGSLALAAAGQVDLTEAAVVSAQAMNTFGLEGKDVTHIADLLAAGANKSAADVHGLSMSLRMGGLLAHQTGLSIEDTVGTLAAFADHALIGSDAGTSLKVMLQRLVPQSNEARAAMDKIGFSAYDSQGKFVGLSELAGRMKTSFGKLTPEARNAAMATIFGADAVRSATILYELGSKGIDRYVKSVNDHGAAGRVASIQTDNLIGDLERLRGAIEVALIEGGSAANGGLRTMTQWITNAVNAYNSLSPELQHAVTLFTGIGGAATLAAVGILLMIPRIHATTTALAAMGVTATTVRSAMMGLGRLGLVVGGLMAISWGVEKLTSQFDEAPPSVTKMGNSLLNFARTGKAAGELTKTFGKDLDGFGDAVARLAHPGALDRVGDSLYTITHLGSDSYDLDQARTKIKSVDEALKGLVEGGAPDVAAEAFAKMAKEAEAQGTSTEKLRTLLPGYAEALTATDTQTKLSAESQAKLAKEAGITADELQDQRTEAEKLADALGALNGVAISSAEREISFRQSLADLTAAVKENGHSLDVTSDKGRKVKGAFLDAAKAAMEHAQAVAEQKGSQEAGQKVLEKDVKLLREQMRAAGFSKDAIDNLTGAYAKLPATVTTKVDAKTSSAITDLEEVKKKVAGTKGKTITMRAPTAEAREQLEDLGYKIKNTKGKNVIVTVPTGGQKANVEALRRAIAALSNKSVTVTTFFQYKGKSIAGVSAGRMSYGGIVGHAADGLYIPGYAPRVDDQLILASKGEGVLVPEAVRKGGHASGLGPAGFIKALNLWGRYGTKVGMPSFSHGGMVGGGLPRYANGGVLGGFSYAPGGMPVLGGPSDAKSRYDKEVEDLKKAWDDLNDAVKDARKKADDLKKAERDLARVRKDKPTKKQLRAAKDDVAEARKDKKKADAKVRSERQDVYAADKELGLKRGAKAPKAFSLNAYVTQLNESVAATEKWRRSLAKIGKRGGDEVKTMLEAMGEEGYSLVNALAGASDKQFKSIVSKLTKTGELAKATLGDFTKQLSAATVTNQQFSKDLQTLAARGFGDLAQALAAQGDEHAIKLARQAASGSAKDTAAANAAVNKAQGTLSGEDLTNSLILLSTLRGGPGRGYAELLAAGLDTTTIKALVPRVLSQINSLPDSYKAKFLQQWGGQSGGVAMARGGILNRPSLVLGGEAGVPESWIAHDGSARSRALLAVTAKRFGYGLVPAGRYASAGASASSVAREVSKSITVNLNGARQTSAEQARDVARHLDLVG
ncbi:phage tail tape measure protein [Streptomyces phaeochromogenes]|uniref:phage tail tape measure protein n=1 Tax=Streptomyces phaeochromogenes TaxID=1923 RepID=UPI00224F63D9|nr:phage tail tape measure protein [Streptomyces phaeochromogenes]MCX5601630.1 phage tail tape measure protein [Streptomyces phaeochromogenes]